MLPHCYWHKATMLPHCTGMHRHGTDTRHAQWHMLFDSQESLKGPMVASLLWSYGVV